MTPFENLTDTQKIRAALHRDVRAISSEACHFLGLEITKPAMDIIAELVFMKLSVYGTDLEAFCKHAKRTVIHVEDVKLLARRNPSLVSNITRLNSMTPSNPPPAKKRKTVGKAQETPAKNKEDSRNKTKVPGVETEKSNEVEDISKEVEDRSKELRVGLTKEMSVDDMIDLTFE